MISKTGNSQIIKNGSSQSYENWLLSGLLKMATLRVAGNWQLFGLTKWQLSGLPKMVTLRITRNDHSQLSGLPEMATLRLPKLLVIIPKQTNLDQAQQN